MKYEMAKASAERSWREDRSRTWVVFQFGDGECAAPVAICDKVHLEEWRDHLHGVNGERPLVAWCAGEGCPEALQEASDCSVQ